MSKIRILMAMAIHRLASLGCVVFVASSAQGWTEPAICGAFFGGTAPNAFDSLQGSDLWDAPLVTMIDALVEADRMTSEQRLDVLDAWALELRRRATGPGQQGTYLPGFLGRPGEPETVRDLVRALPERPQLLRNTYSQLIMVMAGLMNANARARLGGRGRITPELLVSLRISVLLHAEVGHALERWNLTTDLRERWQEIENRLRSLRPANGAFAPARAAP